MKSNIDYENTYLKGDEGFVIFTKLYKYKTSKIQHDNILKISAKVILLHDLKYQYQIMTGLGTM